MKKSCIFMKSMLQLEPTSCIDLTKLELMEIFVFIPPLPGGGYTVLPLSVWPSVQDIFRRIFLRNKLVTTYQISAINSCCEKCDEKCAYMFNVYKNQLSRQTGSRNPMGSKTLPTIWGTYMKLVTTYQISAEPTSCIDLTKLELMEIFVFIPPLPGGGYTVLPLSVWPSVQDIFRRIFLSNC
jgi:hypothetical protein